MEDQNQFRQEFRHIVWLKGQLLQKNGYIQQLTRYDKNGSHKKAILRAIEIRDAAKKEFEESLKGKTYEEWLQSSKKLSALNSRLKQIKEKKEKVEKEIEAIMLGKTRVRSVEDIHDDMIKLSGIPANKQGKDEPAPTSQ